MGLGPTTYNVKNNISYTPNSTQAAFLYRDTGITLNQSNNIWFKSGSPTSQDPKLVDAPNGNLYLQPGSSAIDAGTVLPSVCEDYTGLTSRPQGAGYDIGAYEYVGQPVNQPPVVNAGVDATITLPATASLDGTVTDDGLPNPPGV